MRLAAALVLAAIPWPWTGDQGEDGQCLTSNGATEVPAWEACPGGADGAPTDATYITQTSNATLSGEQALSSLSTGLIKVTNGTGVLSTAAAGTDYAAASHTHAGAEVTSAVAAATALAANPADCSANQFANAIAASGALTCAGIADADVPNTITVDLAATATALAANPADCGANQFAQSIAASGALTCAALTDADIPNTITISLAATATALAANPTDCGGGQYATAIDASGNLTCATPAAGGWPTGKLTNPVAVAVNASYVQVFSVTPGTNTTNLLSFRIFHAASATTVGMQFRVSSADTGNVGNCFFQAKGIAGTAASATAEEYDTIAIGAAPADNAAAAASATTLNKVDIDCHFASDGTPGAVVLEAQLETGTTPTNILAGSFYNLITSS